MLFRSITFDTDSTHDIGAAATRPANIYADALEVTTINAVDGDITIGDGSSTTYIDGKIVIDNPAASNIGVEFGTSAQTVNCRWDKVASENQNFMHLLSGGTNSHILQHNSAETVTWTSYTSGVSDGVWLSVPAGGAATIGNGSAAITIASGSDLTINASGPTITAGNGAPSSSPVQGSIYLRTGGASEDECLYVYDGTNWHAVDALP